MPIRINLLAEAQAEEELRRKDPVKRALYGAIAMVCLVALWCGNLQFKLFYVRSSLKDINAEWQAIQSEYQVAVTSQKELIDIEARLLALDQLRTNRFLWGSALNAFQQTLNGVENIQVTRFISRQTFAKKEAVAANTDGPVPIRAQPASSTEKILITIEANDSSEEPGSENITAFKNAITQVPYFEANLQPNDPVRLVSLSAPQADTESGKAYVKFSLECGFPDKVR